MNDGKKCNTTSYDPEIIKNKKRFSVVKGSHQRKPEKKPKNNYSSNLRNCSKILTRHDHNYTRKLHLIQELYLWRGYTACCNKY